MRDLSFDAYRAMELSIKNSGLENFREPHCDIAGNRKKGLSSLLHQKVLLQLFITLSGKKEEDVKKYFGDQ